MKGQADDGELVVLRFTKAAAADAGSARSLGAHSWDSGRHAGGYYSLTGDQSTGGGRNAEQDKETRSEIHRRWGVGVMAGGRFIDPILACGFRSGHFYQVRPFYGATLAQVFKLRVEPTHELLFHVVEQIWASLAFLHHVNHPHGALTATNVGFSSIQLDGDACLLDLKQTLETERATHKRQDFRDLGLLIYQFAGALSAAGDHQVAALRCQNTEWPRLGNMQNAWKRLVKDLLEPGLQPRGFDLAGAREEWLKPLLPHKNHKHVIVSKPHPVSASDPFQNDEASTAPPLPVDYEAEMERLLGDADYHGALTLRLSVPADFEPRERLREWADAIADRSGDELGGNTDFVSGLDQLSKRGCVRASLRLGIWMAKKQPIEARDWLIAAREAGLAESHGVLAGIYEEGGEGLEPDPIRALECYQASLDDYRPDDLDLAYRMAALILREREGALAAHLPKGIRLLENGDANGHYRSTDLLAQCLALGVGTEKMVERAFELFNAAWTASTKVHENYHTASNNLGVCYAIGFGVRKDKNKAKSFFKYGEEVGHEASKNNLKALAQIM